MIRPRTTRRELDGRCLKRIAALQIPDFSSRCSNARDKPVTICTEVEGPVQAALWDGRSSKGFYCISPLKLFAAARELFTQVEYHRLHRLSAVFMLGQMECCPPAVRTEPNEPSLLVGFIAQDSS